MAKAKKTIKKKVTAKKKAVTATTGFLARFVGPKNRQFCVQEMLRQELACNDEALAKAMVSKAQPVGFKKDEVLITQGDPDDNDIYFLLAGSVRIMISGAHYRDREAGTTVGEMAAIEPLQKRSATVIANEEVVALRMTSEDLLSFGEKHPKIWRPIARMLSRRLLQRNSQMLAPNERPRLFVISSVEALPIADGIAIGMQYDVLPVVWRDGIFLASDFALKSLEDAADESDFAVAIAREDDIVQSRGSTAWTLRDNVVFELGLFMGIIGRKRTFLLLPKSRPIKLPSDLDGMTCIRYMTPEPGKPIEPYVGVACAELRQRIKALNSRVRMKRES